MSGNRPTFIFAGGGTGGHLYPALAVAEEVRALQPTANIVFVGTKDRIEARIVPKHGYPLHTIWAAGLRRAMSFKNLLVPLKMAVSLMQSLTLIGRLKPDAVLGTGGYVSGPVLLGALMKSVPVVIHESNSLPGRTTRLLASKAQKVFCGFEDTARRLKRKDNARVIGTPTRSGLPAANRDEACHAFGLDKKKTTVLVIGGSQGTRSLNDVILSMAGVLRDSQTQLIWQTGPGQYEEIRLALGDKKMGWIGPFIENIGHAYAAADIVLCRAGASTLAEVTRIGKPAILVPYPFAADDHQTHNAQSLVDAGAALMIRDRDLSHRLEESLASLLRNKELRASMTAASRRLGRPEAGKIVAECLLGFAGAS